MTNLLVECPGVHDTIHPTSGGHLPSPPPRLGTRPVVVFGLGNPTRGDDGVGHRIAERLRRDNWRDVPVHVKAHSQLLIEHVDVLHKAAAVVFVDAAVDLGPGEIAVDDVVPADSRAVSFHDLSPAVLVALTESLFGRRPHATLVRIGVATTEHAPTLSPALTDRFDHYCEVVRGAIAEHVSANHFDS
jgi:hydrogenase maturation protease